MPHRALRSVALVVLLLGAAVAQSGAPGRRPERGPAPGGPSRSRDGDTLRPGNRDQPTPPGQPTEPPTGPEQPPVKPPDDEEPVEPAPEPFPEARQYYPPRPPSQETLGLPVLALLDEIEAEAVDEAPLFGQEIFRQQIIDRAVGKLLPPQPIASPPPGYLVSPGDQFTVTYWNALVAPVSHEVQVQPDGTVGFGPVEPLQVNGLTVAELTERLTREVRRKGPREANLRIAFTALHAVRVRVNGELRRGNRWVVLGGYATLLDALAEAGGPTRFASLRTIRLTRGTETRTIDLYPALLEGDPAADAVIRDGDRIFVSTASRLVGVEGGVVRPRRYELVGEQTIREALQLAGGALPRAVGVQLSRVADQAEELVVDLPFRAVTAGDASVAAVEPLRHGDRLRVLELGEAGRKVTIAGAVVAEGEYGFRPGMTLGDLVRLAQGLQAEGSAAAGTIRRTGPDGLPIYLNFTIAELRAGGPSSTIALLVGDHVSIPRLEDQPLIRVAVRGAVNKPDVYEGVGSFTAANLLTYAGGPAAGAALAQAVLTSSASGETVTTRIDLTAVPGGGAPEPNPVLANGDELFVPFLTDVGGAPQVRVIGMVRTPGLFPLSPEMRLADLLERSGGLLPRAKRRGRLTRVVPGSDQTERRAIDLDLALQGDPEHNLLLRDEDVLEVQSAEQVLAPEQPLVSVQGPVGRAGTYPLYVGMSVSDLVDDCGRLQRDADARRAYLRRLGENGRVVSIPVDLERALAGDPRHDMALQAGDMLEVLPLQPVAAARPMVRIVGAVYLPNSFELTDGMTLDELLHRAGGTTPEAYLPRADLWRRGELGRPRHVPVDLRVPGALAMPLADGDELQVRRVDEAVYIEPSIEVRGPVQKPGFYPRAEGMVLSDAIWLAGGLTRNAGALDCEVARARGSETQIFAVDVKALMDGAAGEDLELRDGDRVILSVRGEYLHEPVDVLIFGEAANPRWYPLRGRTESLRALITERVGGLTAAAYPEGAMLLRRVEQVVLPETARLATEFWERVVAKRDRDDIATILSRSPSARLEQIPTDRTRPRASYVRSQLEELLGLGVDHTLVQAEVTELLQGLQRDPGPIEGPLVPNPKSTDDPAEQEPEPRVDRFLPGYIRVPLDLPAIIAGATEADLRFELRADDILIIPPVPTTVMVMGEVGDDLALPYAEDQPALYYVQQAGNFTQDADVREARIMRANGTLERYSPRAPVRRGDVIIVPPRRLELPIPQDPLRTLQVIAQIVGSLATTVLAVGNAFN